MVKKMLVYLLITSLCFLFSCMKQEGQKKINQEESCYTWKLTNDELKEQILEYFSTVDTGHVQNNVLFLGIKDSLYYTKYSLTYITHASNFEYGHVHMIIQVNEHPVCVYFNRIDPYRSDFKLNHVSIVKLMKSYFPEDYKYYKDVMKDLERDSTYYGENIHPMNYYPVPSTWAPESWELTFKDGKMIDKKIER